MRLVILTLLALATACFNPFAPALDQGEDLTNVITEQRSPDDVLQNFQVAYTFKDSLIYSALLDKSFIFEYFDPNIGPNGSFITWGRDVDLQTTGRLFRTFDVVDLQFLNTLFSEREGNVERRFVRFNLNLLSAEFNFVVTGTAVFTFRLDEGEEKWRLIRWKDESNR